MSRKQPNPPPPDAAVRPPAPPAPPPLGASARALVGKLGPYLQHFPSCGKVAARTRFPFNDATAFCTCGLDEAARACGMFSYDMGKEG